MVIHSYFSALTGGNALSLKAAVGLSDRCSKKTHPHQAGTRTLTSHRGNSVVFDTRGPLPARLRASSLGPDYNPAVCSALLHRRDLIQGAEGVQELVFHRWRIFCRLYSFHRKQTQAWVRLIYCHVSQIANVGREPWVAFRMYPGPACRLCFCVAQVV